jgi:hypothetical protein
MSQTDFWIIEAFDLDAARKLAAEGQRPATEDRWVTKIRSRR